ncbi:MAG: BlaI/MecI/CopY family transcriptional regulator [Saprospiraceae bacterium]|nr:BlaI/MecI/CopY family transcriptional regulator [Saprospiraceae bacterium]
MKQLTKAEEEIMQYIWDRGKSSVTDIIELMPEPRPPHSSVSTIVRILEKKGFVDHQANGRTFEYFPLISKEEYSGRSINKLVNDYFDGSYSGLVSFIAKQQDIDLKEFADLMNILDKNK